MKLRLQVQEIIRSLETAVTQTLGVNCEDITIEEFGSRKGVADETLKLLVGVLENPKRAFVLCSSPTSPNMVSRSTGAAREAVEVLGEELGRAVLKPISEGSVLGLSYAVYPWLQPLSQSRPLWYLQRHLVRVPVLSWLQKVTEKTRRVALTEAAITSFSNPLQYISEETELSGALRATAKDALKEMKSGEWAPSQTLMHGDLWSGNVLMYPDAERKHWQDRFMIIDWAGSVVQGFPIYDLIRMAISFKLPRATLENQISVHCDLLACQPNQAIYYLLCALGNIGLNLEHFPKSRYLRMSQECFLMVGGVANND